MASVGRKKEGPRFIGSPSPGIFSWSCGFEGPRVDTRKQVRSKVRGTPVPITEVVYKWKEITNNSVT